MPIYEYECLLCGERTEVIQRLSDDPLTTCSSCGGELKKLISAPAFQFKGTGWYVTDYGGKGGSREAAKDRDGGSSDSDGGAKEDASAAAKSSDSGSSGGASKSASSARSDS